MIPKLSYCAIRWNNVWRNIKRWTSPKTDHLHCQAWAAGPGRRVKVERNMKVGENIAKSWIIRISLQANYDFGEDFFSQQDNDPKRRAKATQNGSKTTKWMICGDQVKAKTSTWEFVAVVNTFWKLCAVKSNEGLVGSTCFVFCYYIFVILG